MNYYGFGTCATTPGGGQVTMEKTFAGILMALGRPFMVTGGGMLNNALVTSPEQLVIDDETIRFLKRIRQPIAIDEESIGVDVLKKAMAEDGNLIVREHTIKHLRAGELTECGLGQWGLDRGPGKEKAPDLFELAHRKVEKILASRVVPPFEPAVEKEVNRILAEFPK